MPRNHARIYTAIWQDEDFRALSDVAQRVYFLALSQPGVSFAGVVGYTAKRWAQMASNTDSERIEEAVRELQDGRFLLVDEDTEELWIRSFVTHDGLVDSPNLVKAMWKDYEAIFSPTIRACFLWNLPDKCWSEPVPDQPAKPSENPWPKGSGNPSGNPLPNPSGKGLAIPFPVPVPVPSPPPSASGNGSEPAPAERREEEEDPRLGECWMLLAQRDAEAYTQKGGVIRSRSWFTTAAENRKAINERRAVDLLVEHPEWTAEQLADGIENVGKANAEQAAMLGKMKRNEQRMKGDIRCHQCDGDEWIELDNKTLAPCPACRPEDFAALGEAS